MIAVLLMHEEANKLGNQDAEETAYAPDAQAGAHLIAPGPARPLLDLVQPLVEGLGFRLLRIRMTGDDGKMALQIMAENDEFGLTIDECEAISHAVSDVLDVENPISGAYALEVSSPGMARPLTRPVDFERWAGYETKLGLKIAVDGQRRFRGTLDGFVDGEARLRVVLDGYEEPQILGFAMADIAEARLVPDEAELKASLKAAKGK
ncbi:MAG: ribosome maturation factor [Rhodobiaceae bacterium]|nr:ribosome maturation factor [Rhodobiaceae bacterium]